MKRGDTNEVCKYSHPLKARCTFKSSNSLSLSFWRARFDLLRRLPDLKAFLKGDGGAEWYRHLEIKYVRGQQTILHVYTDGMETATVVLSAVRTLDRMHEIMLESGLEKKTPEERQADLDQVNRLRHKRQLAMFHREEYVRKMKLHAHLFRQQVMLDTDYYDKSWVATNDRGMLVNNYDAIFRAEAVTNEDLLAYAIHYLNWRKEKDEHYAQLQQ